MNDSELPPAGSAIFCDDIRLEVGGKETLVGVVRSGLLFPSFPAVLPKFCVALSYRQGKNIPLESITIKIAYEHEGGSDFVLVEAVMDLADALRGAPEQDDPVVLMHANVVLSPLQIGAPGLLKARAYRGDEEFRLGSISFRKGAEEAPAAGLVRGPIFEQPRTRP